MTPTQLFVVAFDERENQINFLLSDALVQRAVQENQLPPAVFRTISSLHQEDLERRARNRQAAGAGFSVDPVPHVLLSEVFFGDPLEHQRFKLIHELRHAWQNLLSHEWLHFIVQRKEMWARRGHNVELYKFLGPPLELDAQTYALSLLPSDGGEIISERIQEMCHLVLRHGNRPAQTRQVCIDLLPQLYEWRRLLAHPHVTAYCNRITTGCDTLYSFLLNRTQVGSDGLTKHHCEQYLQTPGDQFLLAAEELWCHLSTLSY